MVFAGAALAAAFATTPTHVIAARAGMGLGAAFIVPATLSILTGVFPAHERGRAIAIWAGFAGAGSAIGPVGAGLLLEHYWWGSVFLINLPIVGLAIVGGTALVPRSRDLDGRPFDVVGAGLSIVALGGLLFAIIEVPQRGWTDPLTLISLVAAATGAAAFAAWERHTTAPMVELSWFRERRLATGTATIAVAFFAASAATGIAAPSRAAWGRLPVRWATWLPSQRRTRATWCSFLVWLPPVPASRCRQRHQPG